MRFFKWLYYPDIEPDKRSKPVVIENIPKLKRKEKSIYKPSDLGTQQDDLLFLKCSIAGRNAIMLSRDMSCRPHEILKLKIKDIAFKTNEPLNMLMLWLMAKQALDLSFMQIQFPT